MNGILSRLIFMALLLAGSASASVPPYAGIYEGLAIAGGQERKIAAVVAASGTSVIFGDDIGHIYIGYLTQFGPRVGTRMQAYKVETRTNFSSYAIRVGDTSFDANVLGDIGMNGELGQGAGEALITLGKSRLTGLGGSLDRLRGFYGSGEGANGAGFMIDGSGVITGLDSNQCRYEGRLVAKTPPLNVFEGKNIGITCLGVTELHDAIAFQNRRGGMMLVLFNGEKAVVMDLVPGRR